MTSNFPDDIKLREILKDAHLPSLLGTLAHATGDLSLLSEEFRPNYIETAAGFQPQGGLSANAQEKARDTAFNVIQQLRKGVHDAQPPLAPGVREVVASFFKADNPLKRPTYEKQKSVFHRI